jgi:hypothetical protein
MAAGDVRVRIGSVDLVLESARKTERDIEIARFYTMIATIRTLEVLHVIVPDDNSLSLNLA